MEEKEARIRKLTRLHYSNPDVQAAIFDFSGDREVVPRYFEGFGKRPDALQYKNDISELVKRGATSFHCSEEKWQDPLKIATGMSEKQLDEERKGWDLLIDIDSRYLDYSRIFLEIIAEFLEFHGVRNFGIKFSGSKGFHVIVPWKSFPSEVNETKTSDAFPEWPRIIVRYLVEKTKDVLIEKISELSRPNKYVKDFQVAESVIPDLVLVSPRHLFRMPYSLHEKTALASVVISKDEIKNFQPKHADPMKIDGTRNFMPEVREGEASELLMQALDWHREKTPEDDGREKRNADFKPVKIEKLSDEMFPPSIKKILGGIDDGKKRALFILLNLFRSVGMEKEELEKRLRAWNGKNKIPLKEGYVKAQISWSYRNKIMPPPNFDKDYYKGIGIIPSEEELKYRNPVNYMLKKSNNNFKK